MALVASLRLHTLDNPSLLVIHFVPPLFCHKATKCGKACGLQICDSHRRCSSALAITNRWRGTEPHHKYTSVTSPSCKQHVTEYIQAFALAYLFSFPSLDEP